MKKVLILAALILTIATIGYTITVNPASSVTADSAATGLTIPYRDANADFAVNNLTATTITPTSGALAISSVATSGYVTIANKPKTFFDAATPTAVGQSYLCSDCTITYQLCIATGTAKAQFRASHSATLGCGTSE